MKQTDRRAEILKKVEDVGLEHLEAVFNALLDIAKGAKFVVRPDEKPDRKGRAKFLASARALPFCPRCHMHVDDEGVENWEVWQTLPDSVLLRYLHEHLAGKAKAKDEQKIDPTINVHFGPIATVYDRDTLDDAIHAEKAMKDHGER